MKMLYGKRNKFPGWFKRNRSIRYRMIEGIEGMEFKKEEYFNLSISAHPMPYDLTLFRKLPGKPNKI